MNLTGTNQSLELVTVSANALHYVASWVDIDKSGASTVSTPGSAQGVISTATTTTVVPAPAASVYRIITGLTLKAVGGANTVSAQKDVAGVNYSAITSVLAVNEVCCYEDSAGWYTLDANGQVRTVGASGANGANGGGTVLGSGTSQVDFGVGSLHTTLAVTGQAAILASSLVFCWIKPEATVEHTADEHIAELIQVLASNVVAGVGFTIHAQATREIISIVPEKQNVRFLGAGAYRGPGQAARGSIPNLGGKLSLLTGRFSVGWIYTQ